MAENIVKYKVEITSSIKPIDDAKEKVHELSEEVESTQKKSRSLKEVWSDFSMAITIINSLVSIIN